MSEEEKDVKIWAVCYVTQESPLQKWTVVTEEFPIAVTKLRFPEEE